MKRTALLLAAALLAVTSRAQANGRFPAAQQVVIGPGARSDVIVLRATFGLVFSVDGGRTFRWLCEEGMYAPFVPPLAYDPAVELGARGAIFFGYDLGVRYTFDGCVARDVVGVEPVHITDLASDPTGRYVYAVSGDRHAVNAVYVGDATTLTFRRVGAGFRGVLFDTVEVAPSDAMRLYVTGGEGLERRPMFYRSDDGGVTLRPTMPDVGFADSLWVSGVDPRDPDTVYVRAPLAFGTELLRSRDGGASFRRIVATDDPMLGFAISDDGQTIWVGSIRGGLLRSVDGGESFTQVNRIPVLCLRQHAGALWACTDYATQPFALGRSRDGGQSFESVLQFTNFAAFAGPPACERRSEGAAACVARWPSFTTELERPEARTGPDASTARRDAALTMDAVAAPAAPPLESCACRAGTQSARPSRRLAVLAATMGACAAARRRRCVRA